jgi:hypothetical protein
MNHSLRASPFLWRAIHQDLSRPHPHAHERVGFAFANAAKLHGGGLGLYLSLYRTVPDESYIYDPHVGALIDGDALRDAMQFAYGCQLSVFHVHRHEHDGRPWFSDYDLRESRKFMPDFFHVARGGPHGALLLSHDSAAAIVWTAKGATPSVVDEIAVLNQSLKVARLPQ